jgi:signal peptidase I
MRNILRIFPGCQAGHAASPTAGGDFLDAAHPPADDGSLTLCHYRGTVDHEPSDAPATDDAAADRKAGRRKGLGCAVEVIETVALTLVIFFVIQNFVAEPFKVQQHSMERSFAEGDYVLVDRLTGRWSPYARGQVVVFQPPAHMAEGKDPFIKRVIGVGGDTVEIRDGQVFVNGAALDEPYLFRNDAGITEPTEAWDQTRWVVPEGELFVMGDHRLVSDDSRVFGPIPVSSVIGRGVVRYWPLSGLGIISTPAYENVPAP